MSEQTLSLVEAVVGPEQRSPGNSLGLVPISRAPAILEALQHLVGVVSGMRSVTHLKARDVDDALGAGAALRDRDPRVNEWLSNLERDSQVMLFEGDLRQRAWTERCIRQSDRLVLFATTGDEDRIDAVAAAIARAREGSLPRSIDLVLVHPPSASLPTHDPRLGHASGRRSPVPREGKGERQTSSA